MNIDPWEALGSVSDDEAMHVLTKLYAMYEKDSPDEPARHQFFARLLQAIELSRECNLNRR